MRNRKRHKTEAWPPGDARGYLQGARFGCQLLKVAEDLQRKYPNMDFSDGVAQVFVWFDGKLARDPDFVSQSRFASENRFLAYVRQAVWNSARMAERQRRRRQRVEALPVDENFMAKQTSPEELAELSERVEQLPPDHRDVFEKFFFEEQPMEAIASVKCLDLQGAWRLYEEAVDMLLE